MIHNTIHIYRQIESPHLLLPAAAPPSPRIPSPRRPLPPLPRSTVDKCRPPGGPPPERGAL
eukprot:2112899-Pyramimonas_sp.AAC.1